MRKIPDLVNLEIKRFADAAKPIGLRYLIIGGAALNIHGVGRYTADGDIWVEPVKENWDKLSKVVLEMGYDETDAAQVSAAFTTEPMVFGIAGPIDILTRIHAAFKFDDLYQTAQHLEIEGATYSVMSLKDLREVKVRTGRSKDYRDVILIDEFMQANNLQ